MKLIVGLGNPESRYDNTRHNVGFMMLDRFAEQQSLAFKAMPKFKAFVAEYSGPHKALLFKPTTYYNESGTAVRAVADFYKIEPGDILLVHDELALPLGTIRTRYKGSDAGNNGVKSVNQHMGVETSRLRIGVHTEHREQMDDADFVLGKFSGEEKKLLAKIEPKILSTISSFLDGSFVDTTHKS